MGYLVAFVGPSGSGKTMLIMEALARIPHRVGLVQSVTTRPSRGTPEDDAFYRFISPEEHVRLRADGRLMTDVTVAGHYYGTPHESVARVIVDRHAMWALLESAVMHVRRTAPYPIKVIKIKPKNFVSRTKDPLRLAEDIARDKIDIAPDLVVENDFAPGGKERSIAHVTDFLLRLE